MSHIKTKIQFIVCGKVKIYALSNKKGLTFLATFCHIYIYMITWLLYRTKFSNLENIFHIQRNHLKFNLFEVNKMPTYTFDRTDIKPSEIEQNILLYYGRGNASVQSESFLLHELSRTQGSQVWIACMDRESIRSLTRAVTPLRVKDFKAATHTAVVYLNQHFLLFKSACDSSQPEGKVFLGDTKFHDQTSFAFSQPSISPTRKPTLNPPPHLFRFMVRWVW